MLGGWSTICPGRHRVRYIEGRKTKGIVYRLAIMFYLAEWFGQRCRGRAIELGSVEVPHYAMAITVSHARMHIARDPHRKVSS